MGNGGNAFLGQRMGSKIVTSFFRGSYSKNEMERPTYMKTFVLNFIDLLSIDIFLYLKYCRFTFKSSFKNWERELVVCAHNYPVEILRYCPSLVDWNKHGANCQQTINVQDAILVYLPSNYYERNLANI